MFYKTLENEIGKNLFSIKKSGKEISEAQKNFYFYKSFDMNEESAVYKIAQECAPKTCYGCYAINQYVDSINGKYLGRNAFMVVHIFYIDDKNVIKYVKLNGKNEVVDSQIFKEEAEVKAFDEFATCFNNEIMHFMNVASGRFQESIKDKLENGILLSDKEKEELKKEYEQKDEKQFTELDGQIILENVQVTTEEKEYCYGYNRATVTSYYVFRGQVKGYANRAKLMVTFNSMKKSCEVMGMEYSTNEGKMIEALSGKSWMFDGKFNVYGKTVIGSNVKVFSEIK